MNDRERQQLDLVAKHELGIVTRTLEERIQSIFADHSAHGRLHSGATIKVTVRSMGELADAFLVDLSSKVKAVAVDPEAFETLSATVNEFLDVCLEQQMPPVTRMASGRLQGPRDESIQRAAQELFDQMRAHVEAKLAIAAFDYDAGASPTPAAQPVASVATLPKKGGRPPAEFWDDMWVAIAVALYDGTLKPKTQADVERAMAEWITANGHSAANSTVRARARRLWDCIQAVDE
jgi:hypothetical protein